MNTDLLEQDENTQCGNRSAALPAEDTMPIDIRITESDVEEMEYHLNECPMANMAADNAVVFALRRVLKPGVPVAVTFRGLDPVVRMGDHAVRLDPRAGAWLAKVLMGYRPESITFKIEVPASLLPGKGRPRGFDLLPASAEVERKKLEQAAA